jgi:hypothetical protein
LGMKDDEEMDGSRKWRTSKNSFHGSLSNWPGFEPKSTLCSNKRPIICFSWHKITACHICSIIVNHLSSSLLLYSLSHTRELGFWFNSSSHHVSSLPYYKLSFPSNGASNSKRILVTSRNIVFTAQTYLQHIHDHLMLTRLPSHALFSTSNK